MGDLRRGEHRPVSWSIYERRTVLRVERLQVEEGFLDGLDVFFEPGLNVIIGARGVGKTSVIELIRYALRLSHVDAKRQAASVQHAESVLAGGRATVTFASDTGRLLASRSANDPQVVLSLPTPLPAVIGQNELEGIGLDAASRLRLIDALAEAEEPAVNADDLGRVSLVESLTNQIRELINQREVLRQSLLRRTAIAADLEKARRDEAQLLGSVSADAGLIRSQIGEATQRVGELRGTAARINETLGQLHQFQGMYATSVDQIRFVEEDARADSARETLATDLAVLRAHLQRGTEMIRSLIESTATRVETNLQEAVRLDDAARPLRLQYETLQEGAAQAAQRTADLEQQLALLDDSAMRMASLDHRIDEFRSRRRLELRNLDATRELVWQRRDQTARRLNTAFAPRVQVKLDHFGDKRTYQNRLANALKGSGLQHNQLAEWLTERVSPEELVQAVEEADASRLALVGELTPARVEKLITHLSQSEHLGQIISAPIDDLARFDLLVGKEAKSSEELSTGQRCSVVLPLLLAGHGQALLLDQPEDHLDNAYLVENTVRGLRARSVTSQTIVCTHNANIPVLGDAASVIALSSDGRRGFVVAAGGLDEHNIVQSISDLMEGGREAFQRRASFYSSGL